MSSNTKSFTIKSAAIAASILTGALGMSTLTAEPAHATYNVGVKSLHWQPGEDTCLEDQGLPCTNGAAIGEANVIEVHQTTVHGYYRFNRLEGNSTVDDAVWLAAEIGAECRRAHHLTDVGVDGESWRVPGDGMDATGAVGNHALEDPTDFPRSISFPDGRTMPAKLVALNVSFDYLFGGMTGAIDPGHLYDVGEAEIDARLAAGMSAAEARGTPFETVLPVTVFAGVHCIYNGIIQAEYYKRRSIVIPVTVRYVPVDDVAPPASGRRPTGRGGRDIAVDTQVTGVALSVVSDPDDSCTLHLSGTIQTNGPGEVQYRFIDPHGQPSNTYSVGIDQTRTAFFSRPVAIPYAPHHDISGDLAAAEEQGNGAPLTESAGVTDRYAGTYTLEVLGSDHDSATDGFNVPFCGATADTIPYGQISVGVIYRF